MTLEEFVEETLSQIVCGVQRAKGKNARIAPPVMSEAGGTGYVACWEPLQMPPVFMVDFDVAVSVSKKNEADAKGGLSVHVFEVGGKRSASEEHSTVNRIKFQVPVIYNYDSTVHHRSA